MFTTNYDLSLYWSHMYCVDKVDIKDFFWNQLVFDATDTNAHSCSTTHGPLPPRRHSPLAGRPDGRERKMERRKRSTARHPKPVRADGHQTTAVRQRGHLPGEGPHHQAVALSVLLPR